MFVFSEHNTLYMEVHCLVVQPDIIVVSDSGQTVTDFGEVFIGQRVIKSITIQNISDHAVDVSFCVANNQTLHILPVTSINPLTPTVVIWIQL